MPHHSAIVRIHLHLGGSALPVAQLGPDHLILRTPLDHPPAPAEVSLVIDGDERRWRVHLPHGIRMGAVRTPITPLE